MTKKIAGWLYWAAGLGCIYLGTNGHPDFLTLWKIVMGFALTFGTLALFIPTEFLLRDFEPDGDSFRDKSNPLVTAFRATVTTGAIIWFGVGVGWAAWFVIAAFSMYVKHNDCYVQAQKIRNA